MVKNHLIIKTESLLKYFFTFQSEIFHRASLALHQPYVGCEQCRNSQGWSRRKSEKAERTVNAWMVNWRAARNRV